MANEIGDSVREAMENAVSSIMKAPKRIAMIARGRRLRSALRSHTGAGRVRSASTKATRAMVSTRVCVRARSGAPCRAKVSARP
jgi:hypothetical protein